jgi:protein-S-isoprenylcysteine O-methyltransferase Ste14
MTRGFGETRVMPLDSAVVWRILIVGGTLLWLMIGARMAASRWGQPASEQERDPSESSDSGETIASSRSSLVVGLNGITMISNSLVLTLWAVRPRLVGPALLPTTLPLQILGIGLMAGGIGLIGWAYAVFRSFRLLPQIEPGHQLCEDGPFAWLRHPIYTGINVFYLGTFLLVPRAGVLIQVVANAAAFDVRARAEEKVLTRAFGDRYRRFMAGTRRFVPGLY